jgi:hypothetical protein
MYTSEPDPTLGQPRSQATGERSAEDVEALIRGDSFNEREGRMPHPELGDGRPDPSRMDDTPMVYRDAQFSREKALDLDDREELDMPPVQTYEDYMPTPRPPVAEAVVGPKDLEPELASPKPDLMLSTKLLGIYPTRGGGALVDVWISGLSARVTPEDLEAVANEFSTWAKVARTIKV